MLELDEQKNNQNQQNVGHKNQVYSLYLILDDRLTKHRLTSLTGLSHNGEGQDVLAQEMSPGQFSVSNTVGWTLVMNASLYPPISATPKLRLKV